jgi:hypothetical protein
VTTGFAGAIGLAVRALKLWTRIRDSRPTQSKVALATGLVQRMEKDCLRESFGMPSRKSPARHRPHAGRDAGRVLRSVRHGAARPGWHSRRAGGRVPLAPVGECLQVGGPGAPCRRAAHLLNAWFRFPEVKQNWLGFSLIGNKGLGLGRKFAIALGANLQSVFADFGHERIERQSYGKGLPSERWCRQG